MRRLDRKKIAATFTIASLALTLSSCAGAGPNAATRVIKQVTDGAEAKIKTEGNDIFVANMLLVATDDGSAVVVGTIVNYLETQIPCSALPQVEFKQISLVRKNFARTSQSVLKVK